MMPTPKQGYFLDGERLPSVTTVIGRFKDSGALIKWAYERGKAGEELYASRDEAADIGTLVHHMVEADIQKTPRPAIPSEWADRIFSAYGAWKAWWDNSHIKILSTEETMISRDYRFGGTPDAVGKNAAGEIVLLDWKTSNGIYEDYLIQLAAYAWLWNENHPDLQINGGHHLVRFSKQDGDFSHHYWPDLSDGWEMFKLLRRAYDLSKQLKRRAV